MNQSPDIPQPSPAERALAQCSVAMSTADALDDAIREAVAKARADLPGRATLAVVFVAGGFPDQRATLDGLSELIDADVLIGGTVEGVLAGGVERERGRAVVVWLGRFPEATVVPLALEYRQTPDGGSFVGWPADLHAGWPEDATLLLLADPFSFPVDRLINRLAEDHPGLPLVGGMLSGAAEPGRNVLALNGHTYDAGAVGVLIGGGVRVRPIVSQGCRPIGRTFVITKAEENILIGLGGRPALERLQEIYGELDESDRQLVRKSLHVGRVASEYQDRFERGDFLVRNVIGADPETGVIAVGDTLRVGQTIQFHVRDAASANADLTHLLATAAPAEPGPVGGLVFTCNGRGLRLFDTPHHDAACLQRQFSGLPTAGFFAQGEIGPIGRQNCLHGFTASIALFEQVVRTPPTDAMGSA
jgi:small ligand-binding sensory domain FIST